MTSYCKNVSKLQHFSLEPTSSPCFLELIPLSIALEIQAHYYSGDVISHATKELFYIGRVMCKDAQHQTNLNS